MYVCSCACTLSVGSLPHSVGRHMMEGWIGSIQQNELHLRCTVDLDRNNLGKYPHHVGGSLPFIHVKIFKKIVM